MTIIRTNFRRGPPVIMTGLLLTGVISQFANASGMIFFSASALYVWNGALYIGWVPSAAGSGNVMYTSF